MADEAETPASPALSARDAAWLVSRLREGAADRELLLREAYRRTFDTELGRLVLLNHLTECGVGRPFGPDMTDQQLRYSAGMHDAAVQLAQSAGFDQVDIAAVVMAQELPLEEAAHDRPGFADTGFTPGPGDYF